MQSNPLKEHLLSSTCSATPCEGDGPVTHESTRNKVASARSNSRSTKSNSRPRRTAGLKLRRKANAGDAGDSDDEISNGAATTIFEDIISEHELAALFGKSTRTLQRWRALSE